MVVVYQADNAHINDELDDERLAFKADSTRSEVAFMTNVFDPEVFCDLLYDEISLSTFSGAVVSTAANPQNPDCEIFANP